MIEPGLFILGAMIRIGNGMGIPGTNVMQGLVALVAAWWGIQPTDALSWGLTLACTCGAWWGLQRGFVAWERLDHRQVTHYWPALLGLLATLGIDGGATIQFAIAYALCLLLAGLTDPLLARIPDEKFPSWAKPHRIAEGLAGALVVGPLSLV